MESINCTNGYLGKGITPTNKGGNLEFRFDDNNRVDTVLGTKEMIIGLFEDRGKGEQIWNNVKNIGHPKVETWRKLLHCMIIGKVQML